MIVYGDTKNVKKNNTCNAFAIENKIQAIKYSNCNIKYNCNFNYKNVIQIVIHLVMHSVLYITIQLGY